MDCGHRTAYSGTNWGPEGQIKVKRSNINGKNRRGYFIIRIIILCIDDDISAAEV